MNKIKKFPIFRDSGHSWVSLIVDCASKVWANPNSFWSVHRFNTLPGPPNFFNSASVTIGWLI